MLQRPRISNDVDEICGILVLLPLVERDSFQYHECRYVRETHNIDRYAFSIKQWSPNALFLIPVVHDPGVFNREGRHLLPTYTDGFSCLIESPQLS